MRYNAFPIFIIALLALSACDRAIELPDVEEEPRACCMAMTASCLACSEGITVDEYCAKNPATAGCEAAGGDTAREETLCPAERQEACTREYMPVCGKIGLNMGDIMFETYGNKCTACAAMKVESYTEGACDPATEGRSYKSTDADVCARIKFACPEDKQYFGDETGCGCETGTATDGEVPPCAATTCEVGNACIEGVGCVPYTTCSDPRPEACTMQYDPVCADKDNGIRCITQPCPSTDKVTYGNGCSACGDKAVYGYVPGACEGDEETPAAPMPKLAPPSVICSTEQERNDAEEFGFLCVDACPEDSYTGQFPMRFCIEHYGKTEVLGMEKCAKSTDCPTETQCGFASKGTDGTAIAWSVKSDGYRCIPNPYANYLTLSGFEILDENGESAEVIA